MYTVLGGRTIVTLREEIRVTKGGGLLLYRWSPQYLSIYNSLLLYAYYSLNCDQSDLGKLEGSHLFFPFKLPGETCWRHLDGSTQYTWFYWEIITNSSLPPDWYQLTLSNYTSIATLRMNSAIINGIICCRLLWKSKPNDSNVDWHSMVVY